MLKFAVILMLITRIGGDVCRETCKQTRVHGLKGADCFKMDLKRVPQCLRADVEVIELSYNRIRKITKQDLDRYRDVKFLYLSDNMIMDIEEDALEDKTSLQALDIAYNSFNNIPAVIFRLPSLRSLYVSQNQNINLVHDIENAKPITSPLMYLDISFNEINRLPNLGVVPTLVKYNISGNSDVRMSMEYFAGICDLQLLINNNVTAVFDDPCECWNLERWLKERSVRFSSFNCDITQECTFEIPDEEKKTFDACREKIQEMVLKSQMLKIVLPVCVLLLLLLMAIIYFVIRRRKQKKRNNRKEVLYEKTIFLGDN